MTAIGEIVKKTWHRPYREDLSEAPMPDASRSLQDDGYVLLRGVLSPADIAAQRDELRRLFAQPMDEVDRLYDNTSWRFLAFERSALALETIALPAVLEVIEPILGSDCHVIANTAWKTPEGFGGGGWHTDAGPHVPRPAGVPWDDRIPYPIFVVGCMMYLTDVPLSAGPTAVVPGSHRSGRPAPQGVETPTWAGRGPLPLVAQAGDVALFSSDVWHRGMPHTAGPAREVFQVHYGRRDIAQRFAPILRHRIPDAVIERCSPRQRTLLGLHEPGFYG